MPRLVALPPSRWAKSKPAPGQLVRVDPAYARSYGLVGAWIMTTAGRVADLSPYGKAAVQVGTTPAIVPTTHGLGYSLAGGVNVDRLDLGTITSGDRLSLSGGDTCTILARGMLNSTDTWSRIIDKSTGVNGTDGWAFFVNDADKLLQFGKDGTGRVSVGSLYSAGEWMDVGVTYDGSRASTVEFFYAGAGIGTATLSAPGNFSSVSATALIGQIPFGTANRTWDGTLDYVYVYDQVLPDAEIARLTRAPYEHLESVAGRIIYPTIRTYTTSPGVTLSRVVTRGYGVAAGLTGSIASVVTRGYTAAEPVAATGGGSSRRRTRRLKQYYRPLSELRRALYERTGGAPDETTPGVAPLDDTYPGIAATSTPPASRDIVESETTVDDAEEAALLLLLAA